MLTALIVDDEPLARARLRRLLESLGASVLAEAEDAAEGLKKVVELSPDVVFIDIQMPDISGIQAASAVIRMYPAPMVVYVTGHSEHAVEAFEQDVLDYLVKPITLDRLALTLTRARDFNERRKLGQRSQTPLHKTNPPPVQIRSLPVRTDYTIRFVPLDKIMCIISRARQVYVVTRDTEYRIYYSLTQLEAMLPSERFLRIHDSSLVNLDAVVELLFLGDHQYELRLSNNLLLRVGRTRYPSLQRRLGLVTVPSP